MMKQDYSREEFMRLSLIMAIGVFMAFSSPLFAKCNIHATLKYIEANHPHSHACQGWPYAEHRCRTCVGYLKIICPSASGQMTDKQEKKLLRDHCGVQGTTPKMKKNME